MMALLGNDSCPECAIKHIQPNVLPAAINVQLSQQSDRKGQCSHKFLLPFLNDKSKIAHLNDWYRIPVSANRKPSGDIRV